MSESEVAGWPRLLNREGHESCRFLLLLLLLLLSDLGRRRHGTEWIMATTISIDCAISHPLKPRSKRE